MSESGLEQILPPRKRPITSKKPLDIILFGATSFVGELVAEYLMAKIGVGNKVTWALAGRDLHKLEVLQGALGEEADNLPLMVADAKNVAQMNEMASLGRVVISTVGPYMKYGESLVRACAEQGTDYCDLTGENLWSHWMITRYEDKAARSGARLLPSCGFDSIPSDLGVYALQKAARKHFKAPCTRVRMRVKRINGGLSGGTIASMTNMAAVTSKSTGLRPMLRDPYLLCPPDDICTRQRWIIKAEKDPDGSWVAPFIMAFTNTQVVHRSNYLSGFKYGRHFKYDEAIAMGKGLKGSLKSWSMSGLLASSVFVFAFRPWRNALNKYVLPQPGEGPSRAEQEAGHYRIRFTGETDNQDRVQVEVEGFKDPGYGSTSGLLAETALELLATRKKANGGGFWTPSALFGDKLIGRLGKAGVLEVRELR